MSDWTLVRNPRFPGHSTVRMPDILHLPTLQLIHIDMCIMFGFSLIVSWFYTFKCLFRHPEWLFIIRANLFVCFTSPLSYKQEVILPVLVLLLKVFYFCDGLVNAKMHHSENILKWHYFYRLHIYQFPFYYCRQVLKWSTYHISPIKDPRHFNNSSFKCGRQQANS